MTPNPRDTVPPDPMIDEVRAIRKAISDQFDNDVDKLCDYLVEQEKKRPEQLAHSKKSPTDNGK